MKDRKPYVLLGFAVLLLVVMIVLRINIGNIKTTLVSTESFSEALWNTWGIAIIIVSFIIFAGGTGILVLLGGGWRWE